MLIKKKTILWRGAQKKLIHVIRARKTSYEIQFHNEISNWSLTTNLLYMQQWIAKWNPSDS